MSDSYSLAQQKPASRLAFSDDGRWLAASIWGDSQDTVDVFDTEDGKSAAKLESRRCNAAISPALAVAPDGLRVAHGAATLNLWSCKDGSQMGSFKVQKPPSAVSFSPSGDTLSAAGPGRLCRAYRVDRALDGRSLAGRELWLEEGQVVPDADVRRTARIGVDYAGAWARRRFRFVIRGHPETSGPRRLR